MFLFIVNLVNTSYNSVPNSTSPFVHIDEFMGRTFFLIFEEIITDCYKHGLVPYIKVAAVVYTIVKLNTILEFIITLVRCLKHNPFTNSKFLQTYLMAAMAHIILLEQYSFRNVVSEKWLFSEPLSYYYGLSAVTATPINYSWYTTFALRFDALSTPFFITTLTIGLLSFFFANFYMQTEVYKTRFIKLLLMFLFSMLLLLSSGNLITLFLGWELIGLVSFLLINFWTVKTTSLKSALKALTYNQVSDGALLLYIILVVTTTNTSDIPSNTTTLLYSNTPALAALLLCICVSCKSAQVPFHYWLPDSMEAPIPASALIHSATLVSAGVFLVLRLEQFHIYDKLLVNYLVPISLLTIIVGGFGAAYQNDLKKILAYSTISNCGFIMLFAILNKKTLCFFYFFVHGLFKALSFLTIGTIVILINHKQDWRYLNLRNQTSNSLTILLAALIMLLGAWPGTLTSYIKHFNIFTTSTQTIWEPAIMPTLLVGSALSLAYSTKIICVVFQFTNKFNTTFNEVRTSPEHAMVRHQTVIYTMVIILSLIVLLPLLSNMVWYKGLEVSFNTTSTSSNATLLSFGLLNIWLLYCYRQYTIQGYSTTYIPHACVYLYIILTSVL